MNSYAIEVHGLSKRYRLGAAVVKPKSRRQAIAKAIKSPFQYLIRSTTKGSEEENLWALRNLSVNVSRGEVVGVIGRNGAGKTTFLKILSRITDPTEGLARVYGRVGTLLAVGTGFHPELSGRDNIFLNGAIMGMKREEIRARFDEIVAFAEVDKFIDTPVKYYSSGMYVRLAFAVAAHLEPEVLLVDEVLAVGDLAFQRKCLGKMDSVAGEGRTVLLVSHNMEAILGLCPRTIWINHGQLVQDGPSREVVQQYTKESMERAAQRSLEGKARQGAGVIEFTGFHLRDSHGKPTPHALCGDPVDMVIDYRSGNGQDLKNVTVWIWLRDPLRKPLTCLWSMLTNQDFQRIPSKGRLVCRLPQVNLAPGSYMVDLAASVNRNRSDKLMEAAKLEVMPGDFFKTGQPIKQVGQFLCNHSWSLEN
jgi:lipopolysaccharide transport system ATP-binding protein